MASPNLTNLSFAVTPPVTHFQQTRHAGSLVLCGFVTGVTGVTGFYETFLYFSGRLFSPSLLFSFLNFATLFKKPVTPVTGWLNPLPEAGFSVTGFTIHPSQTRHSPSLKPCIEQPRHLPMSGWRT